MARIGFLYLNNGTWDGEQIVPKEWVEETTQLYWDNPGWLDYAYQWWIISHLNRTVYTAMGSNGQFITVLPDDDTFLFFTGDFLESFDFIFEIIEDYIIPLLDSPVEAVFPFKIIILAPLLLYILVIIWKRKSKAK